MHVLKFTTKPPNGPAFFARADAPMRARDLSSLLGAHPECTVEIVEMSEHDYAALPASCASADFFAPLAPIDLF